MRPDLYVCPPLYCGDGVQWLLQGLPLASLAVVLHQEGPDFAVVGALGADGVQGLSGIVADVAAAQLHHVAGHQAVVVHCGDGAQGLAQVGTDYAGIVLGEESLNQCKVAALWPSRDRPERFADVVCGVSAVEVGDGHNERIP